MPCSLRRCRRSMCTFPPSSPARDRVAVSLDGGARNLGLVSQLQSHDPGESIRFNHEGRAKLRDLPDRYMRKKTRRRELNPIRPLHGSARTIVERISYAPCQGPGAVQLAEKPCAVSISVATGSRKRRNKSRASSRVFGALSSCDRFTKAAHCFCVPSAAVKRGVSAMGSESSCVPRFDAQAGSPALDGGRGGARFSGLERGVGALQGTRGTLRMFES
jgi:hypothetical protein